MTERPDKITAEYVPAPATPPPPDKIVVRAPIGTNKYPIFQDLHLSIEQAWELRAALDDALMEGELRAESRVPVYPAN
jgi:hypothetical protein